MMQRIRDEAHRFAITAHRNQRSKNSLRSVLDEIPGIGPARKKALLTEFGSVEVLRQASVEDILKLSGINRSLAEQILRSLQ
jgi:excinuclease ABC subunit C